MVENVIEIEVCVHFGIILNNCGSHNGGIDWTQEEMYLKRKESFQGIEGRGRRRHFGRRKRTKVIRHWIGMPSQWGSAYASKGMIARIGQALFKCEQRICKQENKHLVATSVEYQVANKNLKKSLQEAPVKRQCGTTGLPNVRNRSSKVTNRKEPLGNTTE